ncbi:MAG: NADH-ubiquinone/plastoquinone oxidoreductase chain 6 [Bacteroidota bacterium]|nr:NADH-ubiquinone/plastoquinone oxidoreductase chain 6 [Bacteroidota bacterium]
MSINSIIFYLIAAFIIGSALLAVTARKIFRAAIYLLFSMIGVAALYFWMSYEFIAAVQIIVYVGGIVVLIIFSIFLTHHVGSEMEKPNRLRMVFSGLAALCAFAFSFMVIAKNEFVPSGGAPLPLTVERIGMQMLSTTEHGYILPFEVVSMLLLAAMVGCIVIALKQPEGQIQR